MLRRRDEIMRVIVVSFGTADAEKELIGLNICY